VESTIPSDFFEIIDGLVEESVVHSNKEQEKDHEKFLDKTTGLEMEQATEPQSLMWFAEKYKQFGANLEVYSEALVILFQRLLTYFPVRHK
jgi:peptide subunit release factor 1 (eRF1)